MKYLWSNTVPFSELFTDFLPQYVIALNDTISRNDIEAINNIYENIPSKEGAPI